jgi:hypothetical protein
MPTRGNFVKAFRFQSGYLISSPDTEVLTVHSVAIIGLEDADCKLKYLQAQSRPLWFYLAGY